MDDFYNIRMAEWNGYYPGSLRSGCETRFDKGQLEAHSQLFRTELEFKKLVETENLRKYYERLKQTDPSNFFEDAYDQQSKEVAYKQKQNDEPVW